MDGAALSNCWSPRWRASATPDDVDALYREYEDIEDLVGVKVAATYGFGGPFDIYDTHRTGNACRDPAARKRPRAPDIRARQRRSISRSDSARTH